MIIKVYEKYLYIYNEKGDKFKFDESKNEFNEIPNATYITYFQHFERKDRKRSTVKICLEGRDSERFIRKSKGLVNTAKVYWFSKKPIKKKVIFLKEGDRTYYDTMVLLDDIKL